MKEIKTILDNLKIASKKNKKTALATVVNVHGSSYRGIGARMLIREDGFWFGSVSGGCLEEDVINKAKRVMKHKKPELFKYSEANSTYTMLNQISEEPGMQGLSTVFYSEDTQKTPVGVKHHSNGRTYIMDEQLDHLIREDLQECVRQNFCKAKTYKSDP